MKRQALSTVNTNLSRAEKLAQWKEAKSQTAADVKKRPRSTDPSPDDLRKKLKLLQELIEEKDSKITELQNEIETQSRTAKTMTDKIRKLEEVRFKMESEGEALNLHIQQLKGVLRKAVAEHELDQEKVRDLEQRCGEIPAMQSYITELSLLIKCLGEPSQQAVPQRAILENVVVTDTNLKKVFKSEKMALQAEIRALNSRNESLQLRCEELQFKSKLLERHNAELQEKSVAKKSEENQLDREAEQDVPETEVLEKGPKAIVGEKISLSPCENIPDQLNKQP